MKSFHHLSYTDRLRIEAWLRTKTPYRVIAQELGVHISTIYREVKRGRYEHRNSDWTTEDRYSPEISEQKYQENLRAKGADLKIGSDLAYAQFIEDKIADDKYSPEAALAEAIREGYKTKVSKSTLYSYIEKGVFLRITNKSLPVKRNKGRHKKITRIKRPPKGKSIESRPAAVATRERFGDWEMDSVIGKKEKGKTLLAMTERKTLREKLKLLPNKKAANVVNELDRIERKIGLERFREVFKTITVDNGTEFSDVEGIQRSCTRPGEKRTTLYFCHPYTSCERGQNENQNRMVRRWFPKGKSLDRVTDEAVKSLEDWINNYPRKKFGGKTSNDMSKEYLKGIV